MEVKFYQINLFLISFESKNFRLNSWKHCNPSCYLFQAVEVHHMVVDLHTEVAQVDMEDGQVVSLIKFYRKSYKI